MGFKEINIKELKGNFVSMIDDEWALVTAGDKDGYNTMTVSWGGIGELWSKDVCFIFIRPTRHTMQFIEQQPRFTLSFLGDGYRDALSFCGRKSGRDCDKFEQTGLTPLFTDGSVAIGQAKTVIVCKKTAFQDIDPAGFLDKSIDSSCYPLKDYHRVYVGEIEKVYIEDGSDD